MSPDKPNIIDLELVVNAHIVLFLHNSTWQASVNKVRSGFTVKKFHHRDIKIQDATPRTRFRKVPVNHTGFPQ